ncbi:ectonucleotide pyrophosphatase/phosphodiesterase [uncultured Paraglaciecola sp.]|uniref:alkaline phosphatase family protein n=1 Tax=uncultured Paraglaciecola sp. TaxID=1765024 RepID=UPI0025EF2535|nr:ectonucleotide pyrophosphatase/phosphodiesterase [uncultured Paraglaciecola sp.]
MLNVLFKYLLTFVFIGFLGIRFAAANEDAIVIMIGVDGLRADTLERMPAPSLQALANTGVRANMIPAMPTKTFVNFYSLATGLHPKHHGFISNYPYDRQLSRKFNRQTDVSDPKWWGGEPIWITAEKQGIKTATYFWVGSEVEIDGVRPSFWKPYQQDKDYSARVEEVLGWLALPEKQSPRLVTLYFSAVDTASHTYGVGSSQERAAVAKVDKHIGDLLAGLNKLGLSEQTNIVVVADHGMANLSDQRVINIDSWLDLSAFVIPDWSDEKNSVHAPFLNLYAQPQVVDAAYQKLYKAHPNMRVLRRGDFPTNYHFDHPQREPDLMLLADSGWSIYASRDKSRPQPMLQLGRSIATHGYDNQDPLMHATFIANGPAFEKEMMAKPFDNIEVYGLLACALNIKPAKTDGNVERVQYFMAKDCRPSADH